LKGFDEPVEVFTVEAPERFQESRFAQVDRHRQLGEQLIGYLDYWERVPSLQTVQAAVSAELAARAGEVICDIGCGTGSALLAIAKVVGVDGRAIGVDPSATLIEVARDRAQREGSAVEFLIRDGRDTGLPSGACDGVRMERVVQHVGDIATLLAEARRITRSGGRVVVADTDWGSLMIHPGDRDLIRRFKAVLEIGPLAEPWAGRTLHDAMLDARLTDVTSHTYTVASKPDDTGRLPLASMFDQMVEARAATRSEVDELLDGLNAAFDRGGAVVAFTMFVAAGRVP
jgi:ubiquinone/menaquinone biosynthesis C-methylase UbiE